MLVPKKVKYRKWHTLRKNPNKVGLATRGTRVSFGSFGLKALTPGRLRSNQLEAARKVISKQVGKFGKSWIRVFPDMPFTSKPAEVKMGKGKGDIQGYCVPVKPGRVLFEVDGVDSKTAIAALVAAGAKLPVKTKVISRI
ncbi:MAG: 50S ribosomal protein L16 [Patescibacteria group bacterium]